jgi:hypothetical protein
MATTGSPGRGEFAKTLIALKMLGGTKSEEGEMSAIDEFLKNNEAFAVKTGRLDEVT